MSKLKISFFQFLPKFNDIEYNFNNIRELINDNKTRLKNTDLLVFPEYSFSGSIDIKTFSDYQKKLDKFNFVKKIEGLSLQFPKLTIIFGSIIFKRSGDFRNTSLIYRNGVLIAEYDKKALIYNENYTCKASNHYGIFNIGKIRIGLAICWDLILPEVFRKYAKKVDLVVIPSFWGIGGNALQAKYSFSLEKKYYTSLGISRAYENSYALLFVNSVGKYKSTFYSDRMMGGSYFVNPPLGIVSKTNNKDYKHLHTVIFDPKLLQQYREYYATDKDYFYYKSKKII